MAIGVFIQVEYSSIKRFGDAASANQMEIEGGRLIPMYEISRTEARQLAQAGEPIYYRDNGIVPLYYCIWGKAVVKNGMMQWEASSAETTFHSLKEAERQQQS